MNPPKYEPLIGNRSFRVLKLHPGAINDALKGELIKTTLDKDLPFEALSYRWTDPDPKDRATIECAGITPPTLDIGTNLRDALHQFRYVDKERLLWIDQICINQNDTPEKTIQMDIFGDIYIKATNVPIWLGKGKTDSDVAMDIFPSIIKQIQLLDEAQLEEQANIALAEPIPWRSPVARNIASIFQCGWFGRVWTLQEAALAQRGEVWWGEKSFSLAVLETFERGCNNDTNGHWGRAVRSINSGVGAWDPKSPHRSSIAHVFTISTLKAASGFSVARILNSLRSLDCTHHQDRVNSVMRFLPQDLRSELKQKSITAPATLYHIVSVARLKLGELNFLGAAGLSQHRITYEKKTLPNPALPLDSLPSWVPDWTYRGQTHSFWVLNDDCLQKRQIPLFCAGGRQQGTPNLSLSNNELSLHIQGVVADEVLDHVDTFYHPDIPLDLGVFSQKMKLFQDSAKHLLKYINDCMELAKHCKPNYGDANIQRAFRHTLIANMVSDGADTSLSGVFVPATETAVAEMFQPLQDLSDYFEYESWAAERFKDAKNADGTVNQVAWMNIYVGLGEEDKKRIEEHTKAMMKGVAEAREPALVRKKFAFVQAISEACKGRKFFVTKKSGYMGVGPGIIQKGYKICVIPDCCAPFIIRPTNRNTYQLVGECYVQGLMDGEAMNTKNSLKTIILE